MSCYSGAEIGRVVGRVRGWSAGEFSSVTEKQLPGGLPTASRGEGRDTAASIVDGWCRTHCGNSLGGVSPYEYFTGNSWWYPLKINLKYVHLARTSLG